jgi:6,7-dimethyl-8-ribityllumazine synthase
MATKNQNLSAYDKATIPNAKDFRFGIVVSEWNANITDNLFKGAFETLLEHGVLEKNITQWYVPGSFELIYGGKKMQEQNVDAVIVIGSVIQGDTKHFDFVCEAVSQGIKDLNVLHETPVIFCLLTDNTMQQAIDRSGGKHGNKGVEAAVAAIKMAELRKNSF